jgi:hypothetical protein
LTVYDKGVERVINWNAHTDIFYSKLELLLEEDSLAGIENRTRIHQNLSSAGNFTNPRNRSGIALEYEKSNFYCNKIANGEPQEGLLALVNHLVKWSDDARTMF